MATSIRNTLAGACFLLAAWLALPTAALANHDHRKVFVFVIDGLDEDALDKAPFISRLADGGHGAHSTFYPNSRSVMFSETNPNHTAMVTGTYPNRNGITSNEYAVYAPIADEDSCPTTRPRPINEPNATSGESARCLRVPTIFESLERLPHPQHITTALIMGKPKLARLFSTSKVHPDRYDADHIWAPCDSNQADYCEDVPNQPVTGYSAADSYPMDEVIRTTNEGVPDHGKKRIPDFTFANFPQVDSAGHAGGRGGAYDSAIALADAEIERFVDSQKANGMWNRTVMMIVSDHSMDDTPLISKVRISDVLDAAGVPDGAYEIVANAGSQAHIYLTERTDPGAPALLKKMRDALNGAMGIDQVVYRRANPADGGKTFTVRALHRDWHLWGPRAGDLMVTTKPGIGVYETSEASSLPFNFLAGGHGGVQTRDTTFLITGGNPGLKQKGISRRIAVNVDVTPTALSLLNRKANRRVQGEVRREAFRRSALRPKHKE